MIFPTVRQTKRAQGVVFLVKEDVMRKYDEIPVERVRQAVVVLLMALKWPPRSLLNKVEETARALHRAIRSAYSSLYENFPAVVWAGDGVVRRRRRRRRIPGKNCLKCGRTAAISSREVETSWL